MRYMVYEKKNKLFAVCELTINPKTLQPISELVEASKNIDESLLKKLKGE